MNAQPELVQAVSAFCREVIAPRASEIDEQSSFATLHLPALSKMGIMGMSLPQIYGGADVDPLTLFEAIAALAGACGSTASMVTAHYLAADSILYGGSEEQKAQWLPAAASGEALGAFALTEPGAGSNPAEMTTLARRDGHVYHLKGTKHFISNASQADFLIVYAKTDPEAGGRGISAFYIERAQGGVTIGPPERTMGLKGGHVFEVGLDVTVSEQNRLGPENTGFRTALKVLDAGRLDIAACCVGIAEAAFGHSLEWSKSRHTSGGPIAELQGIQWMLADMAVDIRAARGLARDAAAKRAAAKRFSLESSMAKLFASEMVGRVTDTAIQIHGGYGFTRDFPLERYARDARIMRIYEGSSEIQRNIIARALIA